MRQLTIIIACLLATEALGADPPPIVIAYFIPTDREPIPGYVERFDRVMTEVQQFYREGIEQAGYGPMTFRLDRDDEKKLRVHVVKAKHPMATYGRDAYQPVRDEVINELARQGVEREGRTVLIIQLLLAWEGKKAIEIGPYGGWVSPRGSFAYVFDDGLLDPRELGSKKPGGFYHRPCSIGEFNSHYIGGIAHELGHAFGLPHVCQRRADYFQRGIALMGSGNHTYGNERRKEGKGTFLHPASAMFLSVARPFHGDLKDPDKRPECRLKELKAELEDDTLILSGQLDATPDVFGMVAYNDSTARKADYDAVGWTCKVDDDGRFRMKVGELHPGNYQLRLRACHANGHASQFAFNYIVDGQGTPDLEPFRP